jgi:hypothetical protein
VKGRRVPPMLIVPTDERDPSVMVDMDFFMAYGPDIEFIRDYIPGESPEPMPPGTRVIVRLDGTARVRGFLPPEQGLN